MIRQHRRRLARTVFVATLMGATCLSSAGFARSDSAAPASATALQDRSAETSLLAGFRDPPNSARPRAWWHWMNGNISEEGIRKDLDWMARTGLGGAQTFDINFAVPTVVPHILPYMSPEWRHAFLYAAEVATEKGLELTIAASPGWSETGGPWVQPRDGMKKLVWSVTEVEGGTAFEGALATPPSATGPFQDATGDGVRPGGPTFYGDAAVLAYRVSAPAALPAPVIRFADGRERDAAPLTDGLFATGLDLPRATAAAPSTILFDYGTPQTLRSAAVFVPGVADYFSAATLNPVLEASDDGEVWRKVVDIRLGVAPTTVSFAPVTARRFRVAFVPAPPRPYGLDAAAGFDVSMMAQFSAPRPNFKVVDLRLSNEARIDQFETKAGFSTATDYYAVDSGPQEAVAGVAPGDVVDLTDRMKPDGTIAWTPPPGRWRIVRLGYSLVGKTNHPAPAEATGLEVDKLDPAAVRRYMETYLGNYREVVGPDLMGEHGVNALLNDSTEVGPFNWTPGLDARFRELRGYDPRPWMLALTGVIVGSREDSDRFLYDFRRTIGELHATEHYGTVAAVARENGLKVYGEAQEGWRPSLGDDMDMRRYTDFPMAALWAFRREDGPKPYYISDMRGAASVAHLYGQNIAAAESMTSSRQPWDHAPSFLRRVVDLEMVNGINRIVIHTSVHQPVDDKQPGLSLRHIGQYFNRHEAWADLARPWMDYIARSSFLLQQGRFVADVAYFYGEEAPPGPQTETAYFPDAPTRYGYDFVNPGAVLNDLTVRNGRLTSPGGASYRVLYLAGTSRRMTLPMLRQVNELARAGAVIVGEAPTRSPALYEDTAEYRRLVRTLWSGRPMTRVGRGRVIAGRDVEAALQGLGVAPDVAFSGTTASGDIPFLHRALSDGEVYYLVNRTGGSRTVEARFRVTGKAPALWRADTGETTPLSYRIERGQTVVPLSFDPEDSYFVVFRDAATASSRTVAPPVVTPVADLDGDWTVAFQAERGAPASTTMARLAPLNENADPGIRYFSGVATYTRRFAAPADYTPGAPLLLDLGAVGELAEVRINGQVVGTAWHAPFRLDIGAAVHAGDNEIEIRVGNLWVNRLIGDAQPGATKVAWTVMPTYRADAPLRPSGLIGPVRLLTETRP